MKKIIKYINVMAVSVWLALQNASMVFASNFGDDYPTMNPNNVDQETLDAINRILSTSTKIMNWVAILLAGLTMVALAISIVRLILDGDEHPVINLECRKNIYSCIVILAIIGGFRFIVGLLFIIIRAATGA